MSDCGAKAVIVGCCCCVAEGQEWTLVHMYPPANLRLPDCPITSAAIEDTSDYALRFFAIGGATSTRLFLASAISRMSDLPPRSMHALICNFFSALLDPR
jgi:hypothetical protein